MANRNVNYYLVKVNRASAWLLLVVMIIYVGSGFALCGKLRFDQWVPPKVIDLHNDLVWPMVALFLVHSVLSIYFAMRRWGWIQRRGKT